MMVSQRSTKIPGGQTVVQAAVCTMAYVTILPGEEETERDWRQDETLTADSRLCDLRRLVPVCVCDGHSPVWLRGRPLDGCLRVSHPSVSCLLRYHQGTVSGRKRGYEGTLLTCGTDCTGCFLLLFGDLAADCCS